MLTDLVIDPFGADLREVVELAGVAEDAGFDGVWTFDHVSGSVAGQPWSRDPFVTLGAIAARTRRVRLGVLVANVVNRHPAQLASAVSSLQSLAPGRVMCGVGSGASPSSIFASEQLAIGRMIDPAAARCERLVEHVVALRAIWDRAPDGAPVHVEGEHVTMRGLTAVVSPGPTPPIVIGSSGERTVRVAAQIADGVNIRQSPRLAELVAIVHEVRASSDDGGAASPFEISVFDRLDPTHPLGGEADQLRELGVGARTLFVSPPYPLDAVAAVGSASSAHRGTAPGRAG
ncbi:MAG: LLM class flavin-dependent oxidoreductase [Ilumatobacter sp.]|nr:MAG: LLM class flavin-dependent oxidoreductase [Ilumatobacter sp.]